MRKVMERGIFRITDTAFEEVIRHCGEMKRQGSAGLDYRRDARGLHGASPPGIRPFGRGVERERLTGDLYGVSLGKLFFRSQCSHESNASKAALIALVGRSGQGFYPHRFTVYTQHMEHGRAGDTEGGVYRPA